MSVGLPPKTLADGSPDPDGDLTVAEFKAKHGEVISDAADAESGAANTPSAEGPKKAPPP